MRNLKNLLSLGMVFLLAMSQVVAYGANEPNPSIIYESTFDSNDVWTAVGNGDAMIAQITDDGENEKYLKAGTTAKGSYGAMTKSLDFTGSFSVEFDAKVPTINNGNNRTHLLLMYQGRNLLMNINYFDYSIGDATSGYIRVITPDGNKYFQVDLSKVWKRIKIDVNMTSKTMTLYVDGTTSATMTDIPFANTNCTSEAAITSMTVGMSGSDKDTVSADIRVKDIVISRSNTAPVVGTVAIKGAGVVGSTVLADYTYSDAENDADTSSVVEWYMSGSETGNFKKIDGLSGKNITVPAYCAGSYIKAVVTPVDSKGLAGESKASAPLYIEYLESTSQVTLSEPYGVRNQCTTGLLSGSNGTYTFTASDAAENRWLLAYSDFSAPSIMSFKIKNSGAIDASVRIPNGEFGYFNFKNGKFIFEGESSITIAETIDSAHTYDVKLVFTSLNDAHLFVDGEYLGKVARRKEVNSLTAVNIYTAGAGSIELRDFSIVNILTEYPNLKMISEVVDGPAADGSYTYTSVVRNASGAFEGYVVVLALYKKVGEYKALEDIDIYRDGLDVGDTSISLKVAPETTEGEYSYKVIKLEGFDTLVPIVIE